MSTMKWSAHKNNRDAAHLRAKHNPAFDFAGFEDACLKPYTRNNFAPVA